VVQEVFLRIWRNHKTLKPALSFKAYLFKIAYHQILEVLRQNNCNISFRYEIFKETIGLDNDMDDRLNYQLVLERVDDLIAQLPPRQQEVIILRKKEGVPVKEIARRFNISPKTVENHLTEALKKIRKGLGEKFVASLFD
jgi:RNA polymerase sigma-70 factor (ECF subfamily)